MSQEQNEQVASKLRAIFKDPVQAAKVVQVLVPSSKPESWSRKSQATYYKELYALEMKETLDTIISTRQDVLYDYDTFEQMGMSKNTVYIRVNQSLRYLMDKLDQEGVYKNLYHQRIAITKERNVGVRISLLPEYRDGSIGFKPHAVIPKSEAPAWRRRMEKFLETAQPGDKPFLQENLALTPQDIIELKTGFVGVKNFIVNITSFSVKIVPMNIENI